MRTVHLRSVRPRRRKDPSHPHAPKHERYPQVRAVCGAWVSQRDAIRADSVTLPLHAREFTASNRLVAVLLRYDTGDLDAFCAHCIGEAVA